MNALNAVVLVLLLLASNAVAGEWVNGVIKRVDEANAKVTVKHEEIKDLEMPAMTMVFELKEPAWIAQLKPGHEIRFQAVDLGGGKLRIEAIEQKPK